MIKIDGEKIRKIRESQGLTQLYMATAVEVTTDTISRWENKRYPTIKEENAQKLAETLGVELDEILLVEEEEPVAQQPEESTATSSQNTITKRRRPTVAILLVTAILLSVALVAGRLFLSGNTTHNLTAVRIMPPRTLPNSPFPVVIEVHQPSSASAASIILKEMLPEDSKILDVSPAAGGSSGGTEVKWIHKLNKTSRFSYLVQIGGDIDTEYTFAGSLSTAKNDEAIQVEGEDSITLGRHHWADIDGDNTISDQEILTVFDYYSGINDFTVNIELIEKMWLGSGYHWDSEKNSISISP